MVAVTNSEAGSLLTIGHCVASDLFIRTNIVNIHAFDSYIVTRRVIHTDSVAVRGRLGSLCLGLCFMFYFESDVALHTLLV